MCRLDKLASIDCNFTSSALCSTNAKNGYKNFNIESTLNKCFTLSSQMLCVFLDSQIGKDKAPMVESATSVEPSASIIFWSAQDGWYFYTKV